MNQGASTERYLMIPRTLIFLVHGGKILLLKGSAHKRLWAGLYNGIGGHVEQGEDILSSARRELEEEAGIAAVQLWLCGVITIDTGSSPGIGISVFKGTPSPLTIDAPLHSPDGDLEWVSMEHVEELPLVEDLPILLPHVLKSQPGEPPFSASYRYDENGKLIIRFGA